MHVNVVCGLFVPFNHNGLHSRTTTREVCHIGLMQSYACQQMAVFGTWILQKLSFVYPLPFSIPSEPYNISLLDAFWVKAW